MTLLLIPLAMIGIPVRVRVFSDSFFAIMVPIAIIDRPVWVVEDALAVLLILMVLSHITGAVTKFICSMSTFLPMHIHTLVIVAVWQYCVAFTVSLAGFVAFAIITAKVELFAHFDAVQV